MYYQFWSNIPLEVEQLHLLYAKLWVHEVAAHKELWSNTSGPQPATSISPSRVQIAWSGLQNAKQLFASYSALSTEEYYRLTAASWTQLLYSLIMLNKFIMLDSSEGEVSGLGQWDTGLAGKEAEVQRLGSVLVEKIGATGTTAYCEDGTRPIMFAMGFLIQSLVNGHRQWADSCHGITHAVPNPEKAFTPATLAAGPIDSTAGASSLNNNVTTFSSAFPDVSFDFSEANYQSFVWDTMMNDMTIMPFA